jgi:tetratricopeptide (TPR) repeat protein
MFRKNYFNFLLAISLFLALGATALAQVGSPVRGRVEMSKDGAKVPVVGATVDAYRVEGTGKITAKTKKGGEFQYAGLMLGQTYILAVSGPGIRPEIYPKVKAGMEDIVILVLEGDGKVLTEAEAKSLANQAIPATTGEMTEAQKKEIAELEKKNAEIQAKNEKIKNGDEIVKKSFDEGKKLLDLKDYNSAIAKFDEGIEAVPDFIGSTPVLLTLKLIALRERGVKAFNESTKMTDASQKMAARESIKKDFNEALAAFDKAIAIVRAAPADPSAQKQRDTLKHDLLLHALETHRLMASTSVDISRAKEAIPLFDEYAPLETDAPKKAKMTLSVADLLRESGEYEAAAAQYKKILETSPNDPDALAYAGLCLYFFATGNGDKAMLQEGYDLLVRFTATAPDTHKLKADVAATIEELKKEESIKQTKPAAKPGRKTN